MPRPKPAVTVPDVDSDTSSQNGGDPPTRKPTITVFHEEPVPSGGQSVKFEVYCECTRNPDRRNLIVSMGPRISSASRCAVRCTVRFVAHRIIWTPQNTNVVELYSRLDKDDKQLTYYNSGNGTYVKGSNWLGITKQALVHGWDMAVKWYVVILSVATAPL